MFPELRFHWPTVGKRELLKQPFQACAIYADWDCAVNRMGRIRLFSTELKNDCVCVTDDPSTRQLALKYRLEQHIPTIRKTIESLDFAVKFQLVFRYETVVFRRYVLALLLVVLLWKFEAYLVYLSLIWGKFPRHFLCFQKFRHFSYVSRFSSAN